MPFTMYGVSCFATFTNSYAYKFIVPEGYFYADKIAASPTVIARRRAKLFKFFILANSTWPTIVDRSNTSQQSTSLKN